MKRIIPLLLLSLGLLSRLRAEGPEVPSRLDYCGMALHIDDSARSAIAATITQLTKSPQYFRNLVNTADQYMPFVEEAFAYAQVPMDLKYIIIQESAFRADAVSSSGAVGYWQFKEPAARAAGLVVNAQIDERMHIFRSSLGAARYLQLCNKDFNNWVYAVTAYNRGPAGAIPFTDARYYGKKEMPVTGKTHWYALKAIAYKLMFQDELGRSTPTQWLEPRPTLGETSLEEIASANGTDVESLRKHNKWIRGSALPAERDLIVYVPREGPPQLALMTHNTGLDRPQIGAPQPTTPKPATKPELPKGYAYLPDLQDPDMGLEYVRVREGEELVQIAVRHGIAAKKLKEYNRFDNAHRPAVGDIVYLKPLKKQKYHIVAAGETLGGIAASRGLDASKLKAKNRMSSDKVVAGQKLYLKKSKPKGEKPYLLEANSPESAPAPAPKPSPQPKPAPAPAPKPAPSPKPGTSTQAQGTTHTVASGETLFSLAKRYNTTVEAIKSANNLRSDNLYVGQKLRVPR